MISKKIAAILIVIIVLGIAVGYYATTLEEKPSPLPPEEPPLLFRITGNVTNEDGLSIEGAKMTLFESIGTSKSIRTSNFTDSNGTYSFSWLYSGMPTNYTIRVEKTGYETKSSTVRVTEEAEYPVDFILKQSATGVYLDPSEIALNTSGVSVGYRFNVTAMVSNVEDLFGFQVALYYDTSVLNMTKALLPADHVLAGQSGFSVGPTYVSFDSWGVGFVGFSCFGAATAFSGSGKLVVFEFEIIASPPEGGNLTSDLIISPENSPPNPDLVPPRVLYETILFNSAAQPIESTGTDGYYEYESVA
jgi:hypothetical protein